MNGGEQQGVGSEGRASKDGGAPRPHPLFLNPAAGSAAAVMSLVKDDPRFALTECDPGKMREQVTDALAAGAQRIVVSGGDGTIGTAAAAILDSNAKSGHSTTELAVIPGGTLNHFAHDLGIPADIGSAIEASLGTNTVSVDAGRVNGRLFLNTSSTGAYVNFVRLRERLEPQLGYRIASVVALVRMFALLRSVRVEMEVDGEVRRYRSPLLFIGVGEREVQVPTLGKRVANGRHGLHVIVVRGGTRMRLVLVALAAVARGIHAASQSPHLDSFIVDRCTISMPRNRGNVAVDGELVPMTGALKYELVADALRVVAPASALEQQPGVAGAAA